MRYIYRQFVYLTIFILIVIGLVSSNSLSNHKLDTVAQASTNCFMIDASGFQVDLNTLCGNNNEIKTFVPNLNLPEPQRFLTLIQDKLQPIPQPGTYEYILLREYGAVFVNPDPVIKLPPGVLFQDEQETKSFQSTLTLGKVNGTSCYLQKPAADALSRARSQARISLKSGNGGADCMRTFSTHQKFWKKYANNRTLERVRRGEETAILHIVAPPGSSQHLFGLAVDLRVRNQKQREILYQNGWFQTVVNDVPHWTYLGVSKDNLLALGFRNKVSGGISYWLTPL